MMRSKPPRGMLVKEKIQIKLIDLLDYGDTCLYAMNMLSYITTHDWTADLTKSLCVKLDDLISTTDELLVCPSPLLFCVLTIEFLNKISLNSVLNKHRCLECADLYIKHSNHIITMYKDDEMLKSLLLDTDSIGRTTLNIISENQMLELLEDLSVGVIVSKLWRGRDCLDIWDCSSLVVSILNSDNFLKPINTENPFSFSIDIWIESCSTRYFAGNIYILLLLIVYNSLIIEATNHGNFNDLSNNNSTLVLLRMSQVLIFGMFCDLILQFIYSAKTKRIFQFDALRIADIIIFGLMTLILVGLEDEMGPGKKYSSVDPIIFNGFVHSLINLFVWIRFLLIMIATKRLGPFLYMIYDIMKQMITFYFLFACFTIWFAAVFTALFSMEGPTTYNPDGTIQSINSSYSDFFTSFRSLYTFALAPSGFATFGSKQILGGLLLGLYLIITNIILLNLFIALFASVYEGIRDKMESTYRSVVILNYEKWKWDENYGLFALLPCPFSIVCLIISPFLIYSDNPNVFTQKYSKKLYAILLGSIQFLIFLLISILAIPQTYLLGWYYYPYTQASRKVSINQYELQDYKYSYLKFLLWIFCGPFILMYYIVRDSRSFWEIVFIEHELVENLHPFITQENVDALFETLNSIDIIETTPIQFATIWSYTRSLLTFKPTNEKELAEAEEFFGYFCVSDKNKAINIPNLRKLLNGITKENLHKIDKIRIPYLKKAIYNYKNLLGGIDIKGTILPKKVGKPGGPVDVHNMKLSNKLVDDMNDQFEYLQGVVEHINSHLKTNGIS